MNTKEYVFSSYTIPGLVLLIVVGGGMLLAATTQFVHREWAVLLSLGWPPSCGRRSIAVKHFIERLIMPAAA